MRQDHIGPCIHRRQCDFARHQPLLFLGQARLQGLQFGCLASGEIIQPLPLRREHDPFIGPHEYGDAQLIFQLPDGLADGLLRHMQLLTGQIHRAALGHCLDIG